MSASSSRPERPRRGKLRTLSWLAITAVVSVLLLEGTLRVLAYSSWSWCERLRAPTHYADRWSDPFYFQLAQRWAHEPGKLQERIADPRLGWVNDGMDHDQFVDPTEQYLGLRRPVLLFGDSYIRCMTDAQNCFEGWMSRSPHNATHAVFNYGVRAYGLDQIALLARFALDHWRERKPIVVIGIFVEDDLDRAWLDYRGWPKPRFQLDEQGALVEPGPLPTPEEYEREHPLWPRSLAWGGLLHGSHLLPKAVKRVLAGEKRLEREKQRLCAAILEQLERDLEGVERFYVLFPSIRECATLKPFDWREEFLIDWLDSHRIPYVNVKRDLWRASLETERHYSEFFGLRGALVEHLTPDGNEIAFRGILRGLDGDFDHANGRKTPHPCELQDLDGAKGGRVRFELGWMPRFPDADDRERVILFPTAQDTARVGCEFSSPARRFTATAKLRPIGKKQLHGAVKLAVKLDGRAEREIVLDAATPTAEIDLDVLDDLSLEIVASQVEPVDPPVAVVVLSSPRFQ